MFKNVLVGIDDETRGRDAIALARTIVEKDAVVTFAHVYPGGVGSRSARPGPDFYSAASDHLLGSVIAKQWPGAGARCVGATNVGSGLRAIAKAVEADLVVVGNSQRSKLDRMLLGNPTTQTLACMICDVAIAPEGYAQSVHELRHIGVAYDGSAPSRAALTLALRLAEDIHADVATFEVVPPEVDKWPHVRRHAQIATDIRVATDRIYPGNVQQNIVYGDPLDQLAGWSKTVDILVAGTDTTGRLARLIRRSTTDGLSHEVACPLLVLTKAACKSERLVPGGRRQPLAVRNPDDDH